MVLPFGMLGFGQGEEAAPTLLGLFFFSPIAAIWGILRMNGRIRRLANRAAREELALTFVRPEVWIDARLMPPLVRAAIPLLLAPFALISAFAVLAADRGGGPTGNDVAAVVFVGAVFLAEAACAGCTMYAATFDLFARLCAPKPSTGVASFGTMLWCAFLVVAPPLYVGWFVFGVLRANGSGGLFLAATGAWGLAAGLGLIAGRRRRTTYERYFKFE